jgi:Peptidase A4 family
MLLVLGVAGLTGANAASAPSAKSLTSRTFAGYAVTVAAGAHIKSAALTFDVPTISCHKHYSGVGPSLLITSTVARNTFTLTGAGISVACENGAVAYTALPVVVSVYKPDTSMTITPGDKITVKIAYGAKTKVTLTDDTTKASDTVTGKKTAGLSAYLGDTGLTINHKALGVDKFTKTSFSGAEVNGKTIADEKPARYNWVDNKKNVLVAPSALTHAGAFTTTFKHAL